MDERRADDVLSPATLARLRASAGGPGVAAVFTTEAGAEELGALARLGLRPLGAVRGSSVHHVGGPGSPATVSAELPALTRSLYSARRFALARLVASADVLGAVGVVAVRVEHRPRAFGAEMIEIVASGSAVSHQPSTGWDGTGFSAITGPADRGGGAGDGDGPWTTGLDGAALAAAAAAGLHPVAVVFGTCVHHLAERTSPETEWAGQEVPGWTQAVADAREVAVARLQADAQRAGADGVVELRVVELGHGWAGQATEYLATGSAVRREEATRRRPPDRPPPPLPPPPAG